MTDLRDRRTAVYRFYDGEDGLLYVGIAVDVIARWSWHQKNSKWWPQHERATVRWYPDRSTAEREESLAIDTEGAAHNIQSYGVTPLQSFRMDEELWGMLGKAAKGGGTNRSVVLRDFIRWYIGEPDVAPPQRPDA